MARGRENLKSATGLVRGGRDQTQLKMTKTIKIKTMQMHRS